MGKLSRTIISSKPNEVRWLAPAMSRLIPTRSSGVFSRTRRSQAQPLSVSVTLDRQLSAHHNRRPPRELHRRFAESHFNCTASPRRLIRAQLAPLETPTPVRGERAMRISGNGIPGNPPKWREVSADEIEPPRIVGRCRDDYARSRVGERAKVRNQLPNRGLGGKRNEIVPWKRGSL